jgi:hypothetical protein
MLIKKDIPGPARVINDNRSYAGYNNVYAVRLLHALTTLRTIRASASYQLALVAKESCDSRGDARIAITTSFRYGRLARTCARSPCSMASTPVFSSIARHSST